MEETEERSKLKCL